jgi:hypothetical protein
MRKSKLVKDTTREERIQIVREALSWGDDCDGVSSSTRGVDEMYQPYIDGEMELRECNMRNAATGYVQSDHGRMSTETSCVMGL